MRQPAPTSCGRPPSLSPCATSSRTPPASATASRAPRCAITSRVPATPRVRCCSSPASNGCTAPARIGSAAWSRRSPACRSTSISGGASSLRFRMSDTFYDVPQAKAGTSRRGPSSPASTARWRSCPLQPRPTGFKPIGGGGLSSTAADYIRFTRMLLNGGELDGARVLAAGSVGLMAQNQIGAVGVPALRSSAPTVSDDFSFIADGRDKWGLGFLITADAVPGKRSARQPELGRRQQHLLLGRPQRAASPA